jgi:predicted nuclease of restriction endonuclease-like (RecB) superfamily
MTVLTMSHPLTPPPRALAEYQAWLGTIKQRIVSVRLRMALSASRELIQFYWDLGALIAHKQTQSQWGDKLIAQLFEDLQKAFPDIKGLSASNLKYCLRFFQFYTGGQGVSDLDSAAALIGQQPVDQLPWGHNILIFTKCSSVDEARFYMEQTLEHGWSRDVLALQLKSNLFARAGKAATNFSRTLPLPQSDLAQQTLKDPSHSTSWP